MHIMLFFPAWWQTQKTLLSWTSLPALQPLTPISLTDQLLRYKSQRHSFFFLKKKMHVV